MQTKPNAQEILASEDFRRCAAFHGHVCPGLTLGFRAARAGLEWLRENRAEDEELVAIVETDACSADAVQVLTGCTFGKGNFIYRDYGKMAVTLLSRKSGRGVRVSVRPGAFEPSQEHISLIRKLATGKANLEDKKRFEMLHQQRTHDILEMPEEKLFHVAPAKENLPAKARIEPSKPCARCGEPTMESKLTLVDDALICRGCLGGFEQKLQF
jgi:formylmethanofuran dehydrogenase subunit E